MRRWGWSKPARSGGGQLGREEDADDFTASAVGEGVHLREGAEEAEAKDGDAGARGELAELMEFIGGCCAFVGAAIEGDQNTGIGG